MTGRQRIVAILNAAFWAVLVYAAWDYIIPAWTSAQLSGRLAGLSGQTIIAATVALASQYLSVFAIWRRILSLLGAPLELPSAFQAYALSLLPRYAPGKVLGQGMRVRYAMLGGIPVHTAVGSLGWEAGLGFASAAIIVALGFLLGAGTRIDSALRWVLLATLGMTAIGFAILGLGWRRALWLKWSGAGAMARQPKAVVTLLMLYVGAWMPGLLAHWLLARAIAPVPSGEAFSLLVALCASWAVGMLSVIAPAGLGVREGVLYVFVQSWMAPADALLFVTLSRLLAFLVEVILTLVAFALSVGKSKVHATTGG